MDGGETKYAVAGKERVLRRVPRAPGIDTESNRPRPPQRLSDFSSGAGARAVRNARSDMIFVPHKKKF
jgi:hypothetical protein